MCEPVAPTDAQTTRQQQLLQQPSQQPVGDASEAMDLAQATSQSHVMQPGQAMHPAQAPNPGDGVVDAGDAMDTSAG
jgi:hypothetical protein